MSDESLSRIADALSSLESRMSEKFTHLEQTWSERIRHLEESFRTGDKSVGHIVQLQSEKMKGVEAELSRVEATATAAHRRLDAYPKPEDVVRIQERMELVASKEDVVEATGDLRVDLKEFSREYKKNLLDLSTTLREHLDAVPRPDDLTSSVEWVKKARAVMAVAATLGGLTGGGVAVGLAKILGQ